MSTPLIEERVRCIWKTFHKGGTHAHNIITWSLNTLSAIDKERADSEYKKLLKEGF